jgi:hypothetical protein
VDEVKSHAANTAGMMVGSAGGVPLNGDSDGENSDPTAELNETPMVNCVPTLVGGMFPPTCLFVVFLLLLLFLCVSWFLTMVLICFI